MMAKPLIAALLIVMSTPAFAVDGCTVLVCLAGNWRKIPQCEPQVRRLFRDLARGRSFPRCSFASTPASSPGAPVGQSSMATNTMAHAQNCPRQYLIPIEGREGDIAGYRCALDGVIRVVIDGQPWTEVWWSTSGSSITQYSATAKSALGIGRTQFDIDEAHWLSSRAQAGQSESQ